MVRPREFDEAEVLLQALCAFWRLGFDGCSIRDLVTATGLQRQSLYNVFHDKERLFLAALGRYQELVEEALSPLRRPDAGLDELRGYIERVLEDQRARGFGACLMVKTAFGPEIADPRIRHAVQTCARSVRACFTNVIERSIARGDTPSEVDPVTSAAYLYSLFNGLSAFHRTGGEDRHLDAILTQAFASLRQTVPKNPTRRKRR